jgi:ABC-2 type transport system permease protein
MGRTFADAFFRELRFLKGSPWDLALSTAVPIFFLVLVAALFLNTTLNNLPVVAVDLDRSALSREALSKLDATEGAKIVAESPDLKHALSFIRSGRAYGIFYIPKNAEREVKAGRQATMVLFTSSSYYAPSLILGRDGRDAVSGLGVALAVNDTARVDPKGMRSPPVSVQISTVGNPYFSYELMIVSLLQPGLIIIFLSCAAHGFRAPAWRFPACSASCCPIF